MNVQFNLLPAVKLEYTKTQRNKRLTTLIASAVISFGLLLVIVLFLVIQVFQKNYSAALSKDIQAETKKLQSVPDINKILTIQNQLASLEALHAKKPATPRLLEYVQKVTPSEVSISTMNTDFTTQTITISGSANSITAVNKFVDTLKFTTYKAGDNEANAFSAVVLDSFSPSSSSTTYSLSLKFDPVIFDGNSDVTLVVPPNKITTRSETERPGVFQQQSQGEGQ